MISAISIADFGTKSHSRNPLVFGLFVRIRMLEQVGSGIGRIKDQMKTAKLPEPQFKTDGMFTVVLHRLEKSSGKVFPENWSAVKKLLIQKAHAKIGKSSLKILEMVYYNQICYHSGNGKKHSCHRKGD